MSKLKVQSPGFLGYELEEWWPTPPQIGPPLPKWLNIYWPWYKPLEEIPPAPPQLDFDLARPSVSNIHVDPGTAIDITCPLTSRCSVPVDARAKVIIYEGSILPGHGAKIREYDSGIFHIEPGESKNVIIHHTTVKGTIDRRDVEVEVYVNTELIKQSEWDDVYYVERPPEVPPEGKLAIAETTWQVKEISGSLGGMLVKGALTVSSPKPFIGKVTVSIPGSVIAKNNLVNPAQHQAEIARYEEELAKCTDATCRHHCEIALERVRGDPAVDGFYETIDGREPREEWEEDHIEDIGVGVASKSWNLSFPAGESTFPFAFFLKPTETHYSEEWWRIRYNYGLYQYSPEVKLYENITLVDDVVYENGITFQVGDCWPVSINIPAKIPSGGEFWAELTVYIVAGKYYRYRPHLSLVGIDKNCPAVEADLFDKSIAGCKTSKGQVFYSSGNYTVRGLYGEMAKAVWIERHGDSPLTYERPLPRGIYKVQSGCTFFETHCKNGRENVIQETLWSGVKMGEVEVV